MLGDQASRRILVVEDEAMIALDLETALRRSGCEVVGPVATVAAAERALAEQLPDAAVLDIEVADGKTFPIADALADRGVPFVFLTGYEPDSVPERHAGRPIATKPCRAETLLRLLIRVAQAPS
jgi:DNA-binding response OmpR family regulator